MKFLENEQYSIYSHILWDYFLFGFLLKSGWIRRKNSLEQLPERIFAYLQIDLFLSSIILSPHENFILWTIMHDVLLTNAPFLFCSLAIPWKIYSAYNPSAHCEENTHLCASPLPPFSLLDPVPTMVTTYGCRNMADLQQRHLMTCCAWYKLLKEHPSRFSSQGSKCFKEWPSSAPARQPGKFLFAIEFLTSNRQYLNLLRT